MNFTDPSGLDPGAGVQKPGEPCPADRGPGGYPRFPLFSHPLFPTSDPPVRPVDVGLAVPGFFMGMSLNPTSQTLTIRGGPQLSTGMPTASLGGGMNEDPPPFSFGSGAGSIDSHGAFSLAGPPDYETPSVGAIPMRPFTLPLWPKELIPPPCKN